MADKNNLYWTLEIWQYADTAQGTLYLFTVSHGKVTVITEKQLTAEIFDGKQE